ncbi:MAG TPA: sodium:solute symporter family protein [Caldithrix abyssi]|uniref:Sodium:solute symporter family protein n=1 Tax=Caldithrix abyssi TaxID=187145 RepID=A0A7V5VFJ3_CALAY|nr:sodium:solute symporter family protein [Caldithrix abyssi]
MIRTDLLVVGAYISLLSYLGWKARNQSTSQEEYLLSNRTLTLPAMVATLVTTWYGGILGIGEFAALNGLSTWLVFGVPYYLFAALFAFFLVPRLRRASYLSIPDLLYRHFDKKAGAFGSVLILFLTSPAPYILSTGVILGRLLGWPMLYSTLAGALFSVAYVYQGGFRSVVKTDRMQFLLMFGGFFLLLGYLWYYYGSPLHLWTQLSPRLKSVTGGLSFQELLVWFFIASWTFIDPSFHQRVAATRDERTARNGVLLSILFWFVFDMLTLSTALYGVVYFPGLEPLMLYPLLAESVLPLLLQGLFFTALLAVTMSTVDSYSFLSAQTIGRDILAQLSRKDSDLEVRFYTRMGLIATVAVALMLIVWIPSVVRLWYVLGTLFIPPLIWPILLALYPGLKVNGKYIFPVMLFSFLFTVGWHITAQYHGGYFLGFKAFLPGLIFSAILLSVARYKSRRGGGS